MKKNIKSLMNEFINNNSNPIKGSVRKNIIVPTKKVVLVPHNKWIEKEDKSIENSFFFKDISKRNEFLVQVLEYEKKVNHHASIKIDENYVYISLITKNINMTTELDREYANFIDSLYKDILIEWRKNEKFKFIPC